MELHIECAALAGARSLRLHGELTIYTAPRLRDAMLEALQEATPLEIGLAGVNEIDTAGLQVLMAAKRQAADSGIALLLADHSPAVLELIELYDLGAWFGDPMLLPAAA